LKNSNKKKIIYLDIDGVFLTTKNTKPADYSNELIRYLVNHYNCFWLTTHCKSGINNSIPYLSSFFDNETLELFKLVKETNWETLKTEAVDFHSDFYWLEDYPFEAEKKALDLNGCLSRLITVNLMNHNELKTVIGLLTILDNQ
jgi:hypothetical protein